MDINYSEYDALTAARVLFPNAVKARGLKRGYSHDIYEIETNVSPEKVIVRFSNNNPPENSLKKEIRITKLLKEYGLPVAEILLYGDGKNTGPYEFVIMSKLEGEDLDAIWDNLQNEEKEDIFERIGELVGRIHTIKFDKFGELLPEGILEKGGFSLKRVGDGANLNPAVFDQLAETFEFIGYLSSFDIINPSFIAHMVNYTLDMKKLMESNEKPSLIHGDLHLQNFKVKKVNGRWVITGLVDFEYSSSKPREYDFIKMHRAGFLDDKQFYNALLRGYLKCQDIDSLFYKKIKFLRLCRDMGFVTFLLKSGNKELAKTVLNYIKEETRFNGEIII